MQQAPDRRVVDWLDKQHRASIWTTSITVLEIRFGLRIMPLGRRRQNLVRAFELLLEKMRDHVLSFDAAAADAACELMASLQEHGRPGDLRDTMIVGIAIVQHATLATRNAAHFEDTSLALVNPWSR